MRHTDNRSPVVVPCRHCDVDTVWLRMRNGGWLLFEAEMQSTEASVDGNRYAIDRTTQLVVDLADVRESRHPSRCLILHRFRCPGSYRPSRFPDSRPLEANDIELTDLWQRLANARERGHDDLKLGFAG